jgi:hypothetical protein
MFDHNLCLSETMAYLGRYDENGPLNTIRIIFPGESFFHALFGLHVGREFNFLQKAAKMNSVWS